MIDQSLIGNSLYSWVAPAKINLFLHVVGKRDDGYHELQTLFQLLDYGDYLQFDLNEKGVIDRDYDLGFDRKVDLCLRAANLIKPYAKAKSGVTISLDKRLPMGGGLGGGSSDAATVLIALNSLWDIGLDRAELTSLSLKLGADVPVFVNGYTAWAEGVGERLTSIKMPEKWFLVLIPNICVSTAKVFANKHLTPRPQMMKIRAFRKASETHFGDNQLEPIVRDEYPEVERLFRWLETYGEPRMSGSGGSVFITLPNQAAGLDLLAAKPSETTGFVAKGINTHPLYEAF